MAFLPMESGGADVVFIFHNGIPNPDALSSLQMNNMYQSLVSILDYSVTPANTKITRADGYTLYDNNNSGYLTRVYFTVKDVTKYSKIVIGGAKNAGYLPIESIGSGGFREWLTPVLDVSNCTGQFSFVITAHAASTTEINRQVGISEVVMY